MTTASPTTVQLRRYEVEPGRMAEHLSWFPHIRAAREQHGFDVLFAFGDPENSVFTWAVAVEGDREQFLAVEKLYNESPERAAAFESNPKVVTSFELAFVTDALRA